ncbi:MAG: formate dehydrogenase accessory sulfurtransferase FdhD [Planctomycetes bacterium]|nr:formate dehydrogenase accessory sulfurtransferase FdhD [Planctomycetota bacterium]
MRGQAEEGPAARGSGHGLTAAVRIARLRGGQWAEADDTVVVERTVSLVVGGSTLLRLQCLPADLEDLALGLLVSSALLPPEAPVPPIEWDAEKGEIRVDFHPSEQALQKLQEGLTLGSGCGAALSHAGGFDPLTCVRKIDTSFHVSPEAIGSAMSAFVQASGLFRDTGGVHAAAIAQGDEIVAFAEDVGRHNAFDKVLGACRRRGIRPYDKLALVTGRLSLELVAKAVPSSIPVLASRGAPTQAGVALADAANLTLIGFARAGRMNVYSAEWRLK